MVSSETVVANVFVVFYRQDFAVVRRLEIFYESRRRRFRTCRRDVGQLRVRSEVSVSERPSRVGEFRGIVFFHSRNFERIVLKGRRIGVTHDEVRERAAVFLDASEKVLGRELVSPFRGSTGIDSDDGDFRERSDRVRIGGT